MIWFSSITFTLAVLFGLCGATHYRLVVHTADKLFAGTDEDVNINIIGTNGQTGFKEYDGWGTRFEQDDHDNLDLYGNDVGHITSIQVKLKKDGLFFDDWDLDWVKVYKDGDEYYAYFGYEYNHNGETHSPRSFEIRKCRNGFQQMTKGNVRFCEDRNECLTTCKGSGQICTNKVGGYDCKCKPGFRPFGAMCVDIDECSEAQTDPCPYTNAECVNTDGGYQCKCKKGYTGAATSCADYDECKKQEDNQCSQICQNVIGSFSCGCKKGFKLGPDEKTCLDLDECKKPNPCNETTSVCFDEIGSFRCLCKRGFLSHPTVKNQCVRRECKPLTTNVVGDTNILISPAECFQAGKRFFGDECKFSCKPGYELAQMSASKYKCDADGYWTGAGHTPRCNPKLCPVIKPPSNGYVVPGSCGTTGMYQSGRCYFYCNAGFKLNGPSSFHCSLQKYDKDPRKAMCIRTPRIVCPSDMNVNLPHDKKTVALGDNFPSYTTNMRQDQVTVKPVGVGPYYEFPLGTTAVVYTAKNELGKTETCSFRVNVKDVQPPVVEFCPLDLYLTSRGESVHVKWEKPRFRDNVAIKSEHCFQKNNASYRPTTFRVLCEATDTSNLRSTCQFTVHMKVLVCDFKSISGADQARNPLCTPLFGGRAFCQFSCAENKTLSYIESNTALKNAWMCNKGDFSVKRLPDCVDFIPKAGKNSCPKGFIQSQDYKSFTPVHVCAKCPRGTYYEKDSCKNCPVGTYQDQEGSLQCKPCRPGTGTKRTRNIFYQNCQSLCPAGTFSVSGFIEITAGGCKNCPINTFSDKSGSKKCIKCPNGTATVGSGSNSELSCLYQPRNVTIVPSGTITISVGDNVHFDCYAEGRPTPFMAFRKLTPVVSNPNGGHSVVPVPNANLKPGERAIRYLIKNAILQDSGEYACQAENRMGAMRKSVTLVVISGGSGDGANLG